MDPLNTVLLTSTIFSLTTAVIGPISSLVRASVVFPRKTQLLGHEISAMRGVVDECFRTIDQGPVDAAPHVKDLLITTFAQGKKVEQLAEKAYRATRGAGGRLLARARAMHFILWSEDELTSAVAVFRDNVGLLRDACSE